jgi:hypothetical protein
MPSTIQPAVRVICTSYPPCCLVVGVFFAADAGHRDSPPASGAQRDTTPQVMTTVKQAIGIPRMPSNARPRGVASEDHPGDWG